MRDQLKIYIFTHHNINNQTRQYTNDWSNKYIFTDRKYVDNYKKKLTSKKDASEKRFCDTRPCTCVLQSDFKTLLLTDLSKAFGYLPRYMVKALIQA